MAEAALKSSALEYFPDTINYSSLKTAAETCRGCHLYLNATQTVFGEGKVRTEVMIVGEQPGDEEDI